MTPRNRTSLSSGSRPLRSGAEQHRGPARPGPILRASVRSRATAASRVPPKVPSSSPPARALPRPLLEAVGRRRGRATHWRCSRGERDLSPASCLSGRDRAPPSGIRASTGPMPNACGSKRPDRVRRRERRATDAAPGRRALSLARRVGVRPQARPPRASSATARDAPPAAAPGRPGVRPDPGAPTRSGGPR